MGYGKPIGQYLYITTLIFINILRLFQVNKIHEYEMVLTIKIFFIVGKINIYLATSKQGHECGVILMAKPGKEQFDRFRCLLGSIQNRWLNYVLIDVKTPKDILSYLDSCVKYELHIYMSINLCDGGPILRFSHLHSEREMLVSLAPEEPM